MVNLVEVAAAAGAAAVEIPRKEGWALLQAWREIYCAPLHEATGKWVGADGCAWRTFSDGYFPSVTRSHALDLYRAQQFQEVLVLPEDDHTAALRCTSSAPVDFSGLLVDVYVTPSSYEWTMVFVLEEPDYPYFSRADWYSRGMSL